MIAALEIPVAMAAAGAPDDIITRAMSRNMIHLRSLAQASTESHGSMSISSIDASAAGHELLSAVSTADGAHAANLGFTGTGSATVKADADGATGRPKTRKGTESSGLFTAV